MSTKFYLNFDQKVEAVDIFWEGKYHAMQVNYNKAFNRLPLTLLKSGNYHFKVTGTKELLNFQTPSYPIITTIDQPPSVKIISPNSSLKLENDAKIKYF